MLIGQVIRKNEINVLIGQVIRENDINVLIGQVIRENEINVLIGQVIREKMTKCAYDVHCSASASVSIFTELAHSREHFAERLSCR